ncbi:uncharacterized protein LOC120698643 isoform X3 [Panicum virgatum]|uniref:uncharacterized protein LOC120698643 isoform X3 n=1 Tax=Panicum virgatum TaxID=38727 RepID=UPI0019D5B67E|nr:uncharacterized protein LOC120698643 isoform X3 [Panicum virgatum]
MWRLGRPDPVAHGPSPPCLSCVVLRGARGTAVAPGGGVTGGRRPLWGSSSLRSADLRRGAAMCTVMLALRQLQKPSHDPMASGGSFVGMLSDDVGIDERQSPSGVLYQGHSDESDDDFEMAAVLIAEMERNKQPKHGGSMQGREVVHRNKQQGHDKLFEDYFANNPVFGPVTFRRRFRMSKALFLRIAAAVEAHCPYF